MNQLPHTRQETLTCSVLILIHVLSLSQSISRHAHTHRYYTVARPVSMATGTTEPRFQLICDRWSGVIDGFMTEIADRINPALPLSCLFFFFPAVFFLLGLGGGMKLRSDGSSAVKGVGSSCTVGFVGFISECGLSFMQSSRRFSCLSELKGSSCGQTVHQTTSSLLLKHWSSGKHPEVIIQDLDVIMQVLNLS